RPVVRRGTERVRRHSRRTSVPCPRFRARRSDEEQGASRGTLPCMSSLARIGVAIDEDLLEKFDALIAQRGYTNRSEAFRDLIRDELVQENWKEPDAAVAGSLTLVY